MGRECFAQSGPQEAYPSWDEGLDVGISEGLYSTEEIPKEKAPSEVGTDGRQCGGGRRRQLHKKGEIWLFSLPPT